MAEVRSQQRLGIALVVAGALVMGAVIADIIGDSRGQRPPG